MWFVRDSQYCRLQCMSLEYVELSEECLFGWLKDVKNLTGDGMLPIASFDEMHRYFIAGDILRYELGVTFSVHKDMNNLKSLHSHIWNVNGSRIC